MESVEGEYNWTAADKQLEWCEANRLMVRGGPLVDLGPNGLPAWLARWEHDVPNLQSFICDFVETAVSRYVGRIRVWEICSHMTTGGALSLTEEARLTLVARLLDVARQVDEEAQLFLRINEPWGDYQSQGQHRLSPLQLVDALIRAGVGLSGVNLEISTGYVTNRSGNRDLLELSRLIDLWTMLDVPIVVTLICPSSELPDPLASPESIVDGRTWPGPGNETIQSNWITQVLELLVAKLRVAGVFLPHFSDGAPHEFPHAGLLRADQTPKTVAGKIVEQRQYHRRKP